MKESCLSTSKTIITHITLIVRSSCSSVQSQKRTIPTWCTSEFPSGSSAWEELGRTLALQRVYSLSASQICDLRMSEGAVMRNFLLALCMGFLEGARASSNNDAIGDNNLGLLAQACSKSYCNSKTSALDLWISLEQVQMYIVCFKINNRGEPRMKCSSRMRSLDRNGTMGMHSHALFHPIWRGD